LSEARQLWTTVARPNAIKVPAMTAGLPAIRTLISEGINVNVTLLFARDGASAAPSGSISDRTSPTVCARSTLQSSRHWHRSLG